MTYSMHNPTNHSRGAASKGHLNLLHQALEELDRDLGHDYVPMDLFIDQRTIDEHFHESSIRSRSTGGQA